MHCYLPDDAERTVRLQAERTQLPLSRFLAELVKREVTQHTQWPEGYFDQVFGRWEGEPLTRESERAFEQRSDFK